MDTNKLIGLMPDMAIFVTVVEKQSFSRASEQLGVAPSSVSRSVARLESAFESKLLERTTRRLRLTSTGAEVFQSCRDMLGAAKLAASAAQSRLAEPSGLLKIAAPKALSHQVLMPMVLAFIEQYPHLSVRFRVEDRYLDPVRDDIDVVIQLTESPVEGLVATTLATTEMWLCASPDYLAAKGAPQTPDDLTAFNCIALSEDEQDCYWHFERREQLTSVRVSGRLAVNHSGIRHQAVSQGMGISVFPDFVIREAVEQGDVVRLLTDWNLKGKYQGRLVAQYAASRFIPVQVRAFISFLQQQFAIDR